MELMTGKKKYGSFKRWKSSGENSSTAKRRQDLWINNWKFHFLKENKEKIFFFLLLNYYLVSFDRFWRKSGFSWRAPKFLRRSRCCCQLQKSRELISSVQFLAKHCQKHREVDGTGSFGKIVGFWGFVRQKIKILVFVCKASLRGELRYI